MNTRVALVLILVAVLGYAANYKEEFAGKVALVTGGSSGIGYQTALQLAQYGAKVIIVARDDHESWFNGTTACKNINNDPVVNQTGGSCRFFKGDVSKKEDVKALFENIRKNENDLDFCVNSAGIGGPLGLLHENRGYINGTHCPMRNNVYGVIYSLMHELRFFNEKNHTGAIVNLASVNGVKATPTAALYGASKFAIVGITRSVAVEHAVFAKGIAQVRINALAPGLTDTSLTWQQYKYFVNHQQPWEGEYFDHSSPNWEQFKKACEEQCVSLHMASPKNMADSILFLLSSDASFITGQVFMVDRGSIA